MQSVLFTASLVLLAACIPESVNVLEGDDLSRSEGKHTIAVRVTRVSAEDAAGLTLGGYVTDAELGAVLRGASVQVEGTRRGAAADSAGYFVFDSLDVGQTLRVTSVGYDVLSVPVARLALTELHK